MVNDFTLLLVEPNEELQQSLCNILQIDFGIEHVMLAESQEQSLRYLKNDAPINCLIINAQLSDGSGFELVSVIKNMKSYNDTPILILSEQQDPSQLLQAAACGATDFVIKPFTPLSFGLKFKKLITGQEFRNSTRISTFELIQLEIDFSGTQIYNAKLTDISTNGCSVISELFSQGGCVYDTADIHFKCYDKSFSLSAELIRTECDPETESLEKKELIAAFKFSALLPHHQKMLRNFIAHFNSR